MFENINHLALKGIMRTGLAYVDSSFDPKKIKKARVTILAKDTYFETERSFPFSSLNDIKDAVKSDISEYSPFDTDLLFLRKIDETEGKTRVNLWFVKKDIAEAVLQLSPVLIFPETFILIFAGKDGPTFFDITKNGEKKLFVYVDQNSAVKSLESNSGSNIMEGFARVCNKPDSTRVMTITDSKDLMDFLETELPNVPFYEGVRCLNRSFYSFESMGKIGLRYLYLGLLVIFIYTGASVWLVSHKKNQLESLEKQIINKAASLIEKRNLLEKRVDRLNLLKNMVEGYQPRTTLIRMISKIAPQGTLIKRITISGQTVEIEGAAPDASAFMEALAKAEGILDPRFTSPIKKDKTTGLDRFKLLFENRTKIRKDSDESN
jgi:hypothetical protein